MARAKKKADTSTGSFFEEDYLVRTLGRIAHDPEVALTELVANAWDAGASLVDITVPGVRDTALVVQDDGHGMTAMQFKGRWMRLGYDRIKHQGVQVEFPRIVQHGGARPMVEMESVAMGCSALPTNTSWKLGVKAKAPGLKSGRKAAKRRSRSSRKHRFCGMETARV
jgi:hypothetical protein